MRAIEPNLNRRSQRPNLNQFEGVPGRARLVLPGWCARRPSCAELLVSYNSMYRPLVENTRIAAGRTCRHPRGRRPGHRPADRPRRAGDRRDPSRAGRAEPPARREPDRRPGGDQGPRRQGPGRVPLQARDGDPAAVGVAPPRPRCARLAHRSRPRPGVPAQHVRGSQDHRARGRPTRRRAGHARGAGGDPVHLRGDGPGRTTRRATWRRTSATTR